ncbi:MAG: carboxypeptidase-like regulatory domain-containing protein, partial [Terriglobales bacterium]
MKRFAAIFVFSALPFLGPSMFGQRNSGELRLRVVDPSGLAVKTTVQIISEANQYRNTLTTDDQGDLDAKRLFYGIYQVQIEAPG